VSTTRQVQIEGQSLSATYRPLWWHEKGLSYTASGYGGKIPTPWVVRVGSKTHRIYVAQYSNLGTAYIQRGGKGLCHQNIVESY
jgi:hypothetical protein